MAYVIVKIASTGSYEVGKAAVLHTAEEDAEQWVDWRGIGDKRSKKLEVTPVMFHGMHFFFF